MAKRQQIAVTQRVRAALRTLPAILLLLMVSGCKEPIYHQLSEREANDVLLTLLKGGVEAEKKDDGEKHYSVLVDDAKMALAIELLKANAQPEEAHSSMGELFARNQLIATPTEERVRFIYGVEQALSTTLSKIDGVLVARVHIVLPANDPLATEMKPASASVFIKHRPDVNMQVAMPAVKDMVVRSVEGLTPDRVAVTLFPASATSSNPNQVPITRFFGALVASSSTTTLWVLMGIPWAIALMLLVLLMKATQVRRLMAAYLKKRTPKKAFVANDDEGDFSVNTR